MTHHEKIKSFSLRKYVLWNFVRAALLPLLFIEITLVLLYFLVNAYNHENSSETLQNEAISHLKTIVMDQSQILSKEFTAMYAICSVFQKEIIFFYQHPDLMPVASIRPAQYKFAPNGVYYRSNKTPGAASLYYSTVTAIGSAEKEKAARSEVLDHVFKNIVDLNDNVVAAYLNTHDSMNRYYPFIDNVFDQYLPDMNIPKFNFYYLADREHNPDKGPVWTDTYLDPAGQGWMMSCISPVYKGDFLEGVAGIDITIDNMLKTILSIKLPWNAEGFLVDRSGIIMAMPPGIEKKFKLTELRKHIYSCHVTKDTFKPEEFNLLKSPLPELRKVADHLPQVHIDFNRIIQVLNNLIGNALKFTPKGGRITVEAREAHGSAGIEVSVADTGAGIPQKDLQRVFERFLQLGERRQTDISGTGLATIQAVNTGIIGTGVLDAGSISAGFGAIDVGADDITTTGTLFGSAWDGTGAVALTIGSADITSLTVTTDSTGNGEVALPAGSIGYTELDSYNSADDEQCLTYESASGNFEWQACGSGTTYTAGNDLDLAGTVFALETTLDFVDTINLTGTGTLNGLDAIDSTTETTLEGALDIAGDVTGTGLTAVTVAHCFSLSWIATSRALASYGLITSGLFP